MPKKRRCLLLFCLMTFFSPILCDSRNMSAIYDNETKSFNTAVDSLFILESRSFPVSGQLVCIKALRALLLRQGIPIRLDLLRQMKDVELYQLALLAALGGASKWNRDSGTNLVVISDDNGALSYPNTPKAVEGDLMLCVVCALLTVIAMHHMTPPQQPQQPPHK